MSVHCVLTVASMSLYLSKLKKLNDPDIDTKVLIVCFSRESKIWRLKSIYARNFWLVRNSLVNNEIVVKYQLEIVFEQRAEL